MRVCRVSALAEHVGTYGHLIDGVLRAVTGRTLGEIQAEDNRPALGMDGWFGVLAEELPRVAELETALPGGAKQFVREVCPSYERVLEYPHGSVELGREDIVLAGRFDRIPSSN